MASRTLFYRCARGQDAQSVDTWYLVHGDDRTHWVEHSWSHCDKADKPDVGTETLSVAEVLLTVDDAAVLACFKAVVSDVIQRCANPKKTDAASESLTMRDAHVEGEYIALPGEPHHGPHANT